MSMHLLGAAMVAVMVLAPFALQVYIQKLPVAPMCPSCRSVTRQQGTQGGLLRVLPAFVTTSLGECTHCGWRGRMRWRWATRSVRNDGG